MYKITQSEIYLLRCDSRQSSHIEEDALSAHMCDSTSGSLKEAAFSVPEPVSPKELELSVTSSQDSCTTKALPEFVQPVILTSTSSFPLHRGVCSTGNASMPQASPPWFFPGSRTFCPEIAGSFIFSDLLFSSKSGPISTNHATFTAQRSCKKPQYHHRKHMNTSLPKTKLSYHKPRVKKKLQNFNLWHFLLSPRKMYN